MINVHGRLLSLSARELDSLREDEIACGRVILARRSLATRLATWAGSDGPMPDVLRHAFGVLSARHCRALRDAVLAGRVDAALVAFDGPAITAALGSELAFETYQGVGPVAPHKATIRTDEAYEVRTPHGGFAIRVGNGVELWRAATLRTKEPDTIAWLDETLGAGDVFWDVGANIGGYTLWAAHLRRGVRVVAVEPDPITAARLVQNIAINEFADAVPLPVALGRDEFAAVAFRRRGLAAAVASPDPVGRAGRDGDITLMCVTTTLDSLVAGPRALPAPTHLKVDVDGAELDVLAGAAGALGAMRHALVEVADTQFAAVDDCLRRAGLHRAGERWQAATTPRGRIGNVRYARDAGDPGGAGVR